MKRQSTAEHTFTMTDEEARLLHNALHAMRTKLGTDWKLYDQHDMVSELMTAIATRPRVDR